MKRRLMIATSLAAMLCIATACFDKGNDRLDIILEGPWILYRETQFRNDNGKAVPVLIAIAATRATIEPLPANDKLHHHLPQISTGDGYYIDKPAVYCLTFNDKCAPKGPSSFNSDPSYPTPHLLTVSRKNPSTPWDWVSASHRQTALILPMPDSFSNDGVWEMKFAGEAVKIPGEGYPDPSEQHSIGLQLHYVHGPDRLNIRKCGPLPTVANCNLSPQVKGLTLMQNTGTLRIQMRAPDNDNGCDVHVRSAYNTAFTDILNGPDFDQNKTYIEPAHVDTKTHQPTFDNPTDHPCFCDDPFRPRPSPFCKSDKQKSGNAQNAMPGMPKESVSLAPESSISLLQTQLDGIAKLFEDAELKKHKEQEDLASAVEKFKAAEDAAHTINPDFPGISELQRIGQLLQESERSIDKFEAAPDIKISQQLYKLLNTIKTSEQADSPKSGADCLAPTMRVP
jgi:hypothetical protein